MGIEHRSKTKGKTLKVKTVKGKTVKDKTLKVKTVKGKTVKVKTAKGKTVKGKTVKGKTIKGKTVKTSRNEQNLRLNLNSILTQQNLEELQKYASQYSHFKNLPPELKTMITNDYKLGLQQRLTIYELEHLNKDIATRMINATKIDNQNRFKEVFRLYSNKLKQLTELGANQNTKNIHYTKFMDIYEGVLARYSNTNFNTDIWNIAKMHRNLPKRNKYTSWNSKLNMWVTNNESSNSENW